MRDAAEPASIATHDGEKLTYLSERSREGGGGNLWASSNFDIVLVIQIIF